MSVAGCVRGGTGNLCALGHMLHGAPGTGECVAGILEVTGMARPGHVSLRYEQALLLASLGKRGPCL